MEKKSKELKKKIQEIDTYLKKLSWSRTDLADLVLEDKYADQGRDVKDFGDRNKLGRNITKQLQRNSTPDNLLDYYLRVIEGHPSFSDLKLGKIRPTYATHDCLSDNMNAELKIVSQELDDVLSKKEDNESLSEESS